MTRAPLVSAVIPTYRHRDTVLATLDSVFAQTFADYEVLVVDDGSPDDTAALLQPLADAGRLVLIRQANQGQAAARNRGLAAARGRYIAFLDDDDLWPPDRLAWQVEMLERDPTLVLAYGPCLKLRGGQLHPGPDGPHPSGWVRDALLNRYCLTSPGQATIRAATLLQVGGFDPELWGVDDWDLYLRLAGAGRFGFADRIALHYREHEGNASHDAVRHARNAWLAYRKHAGWNVPQLRTLARGGARYFVPRLLEHAEAALVAKRPGAALAAYAYATAFRPGLLLRRHFVGSVTRAALRIVPSGG